MLVLADEHLAELGPMYREAARLLVAGGHFVLVGYHPFFLMQGMPTHYHRAGTNRESIAIRSYVHLFSEHFDAAKKAGLGLSEFRGCVIDEKSLGMKPKWREAFEMAVDFYAVMEKR